MIKIMYPNSRFVDAYVGPFQDNHFGTFRGDNAAMRAIREARNTGYRFVSLMYGNGNMETVETINPLESYENASDDLTH